MVFADSRFGVDDLAAPFCRRSSGFIVAVVISYAIPIEGQWRWKRPSPHALRLAAKYTLGGIIFLLAGVLIPGSYFYCGLRALY